MSAGDDLDFEAPSAIWSVRDRLLLVFATLLMDEVIAYPAQGQTAAVGHDLMHGWLACAGAAEAGPRTVATGYAFWTLEDDRHCFDGDGSLTQSLPVHCDSDSVGVLLAAAGSVYGLSIVAAPAAAGVWKVLDQPTP